MPSPALLRALLEQPIAGRRAPGGRAWPPSQLRAGLGPRVRIPREPLPQHQFLRLRAAAPEAAERKPGKESEPLAGGRSQGGDSKDAEEDRDEEGASFRSRGLSPEVKSVALWDFLPFSLSGHLGGCSGLGASRA
nr:large ribosomal subunit protein eL30 isoform X1 [Delphinus delphis]